MDRCPTSPHGSLRGLYSGVVLVGLGLGMVAGQGTAAAGPAPESGTSQSPDTAGTDKDTEVSTTERVDPADDEVDDAGDDATDPDDVEAEVDPEADDDQPSRRSRARAQQHTTEETDETENADEPGDVDAAGAPVEAPTDAAPDTETTTAPAPASALRTAVSSRPVTVESMVTDVLTWVGLRPLADDGPAPATPVSALVQSLWLAVRQSQYTWNNQRPTAEVTTSGPGPDGEVTGNLNATDYDDVALTYTVTARPAHGRVVLDTSGGFTYIPGAAAGGRADSFTVSIDDTTGNPFHVHGLLGLLGLTRPAEVTVVIDASSLGLQGIPSGFEVGELLARDGVAVTPGRDGGVGVIDGRFTDQLVVNAADAAVVLNSLAPALGAWTGFADPSAITASTVGRGESAEIFYRFTEKVGPVKVLGSEVILVTNAAGEVTGVFNYYRGLGESFDVTPDASVDEDAEVRLIASSAYLGSGADARILRKFLTASAFAEELVVFTDDDGNSSLAWRVAVVARDTGELAPSGATYLIHADGTSAGSVIVSSSNAHAATSISLAKDWLGESRLFTVDTRKVWWFRTYQLIDAPRNITTYKTTYTLFGLGNPRLPGSVVKRGLFGWDAAAVSAHANMALVYDYFEEVLGRTSFDGEGARISVSIRYNPRMSTAGYANAFWDPNRQLFAFGDSGYLQAGLDVVAHEFAHAVTSHVVGDGGPVLDFDEPGALNEAYSDIFGVLIEGKTGAGRWLVGEDSELGAVRDLADPASIVTGFGPYRDRYSQRYTGEGDDRGEHVNSTIFSHAAYLMMTDPATDAVSDETWATVFYHSLGRLSSTARFVDGRAAVLSTARGQGLTPAQLTAIARAFDTVEIYGAAPSVAIAV
ncbi:M4 family metallopeptidase [Mycobacterium sp. NAZ190054]|uniref:M4 family metallopeptidase n=1 Tax=Mycobacterium sp. NAZ190054 TaxID=1747766 RepID=UPI0007936B30|nr:M4 family metallopeptidase [Mycobacterium sp. NAZ190054]KWX65711.1 peptidase M4 [Mycobacterium sp. NAZ190054]